MSDEESPNRVRSQPPLSRGVWVLAIVVGVICAVFAVIIVATPVAPGAAAARPDPVKSRGGFGLGLGVGVGVGVMIGYVLGRRRKR